MGIPKRHWYHNSEQCKNQHYTGVLSAREFAAIAEGAAAYCRKCYRAAVKAIPAEDAKPKRHNGHCTWPGCSSFAINPGHQGRDETSDLSLCDVCYWKRRAPVPRPISEARYTEILGYCPDIGWRRLSRIGQKWGLTGAEHIADYEPTHFLPLPPSPEVK